jgi:molybdopterin-guanine dinucleotide biosynthesis protein A
MGEGRESLKLVGFAVAGGRSSRMGRDKATLPWGDGDLLDHALRRLRGVTPDVRVLCGPARAYEDRGVPVLTDALADIGTLAALVAALRALPAGGTAVLLAVDLPLVTVPLLRHVAVASHGFDAAVPLSTHGVEPLCAAYGAACLPAIEREIAGGNYRLTGFWSGARVREVGIAELATLGDVGEMFLNANTPADYARARDAAARKK